MPNPETFTVELPYGDFLFHHVEDTLSAPGQSSPLRVVDEVCVHLAGTATSVTAQVERSTRNPDSSPNWAPAGAVISGSAAAGLDIRRYMEPTRGWWRVNVTDLSGGSLTIDVSGQKA